jgi:hypothetical protein
MKTARKKQCGSQPARVRELSGGSFRSPRTSRNFRFEPGKSEFLDPQ